MLFDPFVGWQIFPRNVLGSIIHIICELNGNDWIAEVDNSEGQISGLNNQFILDFVVLDEMQSFLNRRENVTAAHFVIRYYLFFASFGRSDDFQTAEETASQHRIMMKLFHISNFGKEPIFHTKFIWSTEHSRHSILAISLIGRSREDNSNIGSNSHQIPIVIGILEEPSLRKIVRVGGRSRWQILSKDSIPRRCSRYSAVDWLPDIPYFWEMGKVNPENHGNGQLTRYNLQ